MFSVTLGCLDCLKFSQHDIETFVTVRPILSLVKNTTLYWREVVQVDNLSLLNDRELTFLSEVILQTFKLALVP